MAAFGTVLLFNTTWLMAEAFRFSTRYNKKLLQTINDYND